MPNQGKSIAIKLYRLTKTNPITSNEVSRMVVAGADEKDARQVANQESGDSGYYWTDGSLVLCEEIGLANDGVYGVLASERQ